MAKLTSLRQDKQKQNEGVWISFEGIDFKIARLQNDRYKALVASNAANNRERIERGEPQRDPEEFWCDLLASTVLLDWRNLEDDNGEPLKYSVEEAFKILLDARYSDVKDFIETQATTRRNFKEAAESKAEKN